MNNINFLSIARALSKYDFCDYSGFENIYIDDHPFISTFRIIYAKIYKNPEYFVSIKLSLNYDDFNVTNVSNEYLKKLYHKIFIQNSGNEYEQLIYESIIKNITENNFTPNFIPCISTSVCNLEQIYTNLIQKSEFLSKSFKPDAFNFITADYIHSVTGNNVTLNQLNSQIYMTQTILAMIYFILRMDTFWSIFNLISFDNTYLEDIVTPRKIIDIALGIIQTIKTSYDKKITAKFVDDFYKKYYLNMPNIYEFLIQFVKFDVLMTGVSHNISRLSDFIRYEKPKPSLWGSIFSSNKPEVLPFDLKKKLDDVFFQCFYSLWLMEGINLQQNNLNITNATLLTLPSPVKMLFCLTQDPQDWYLINTKYIPLFNQWEKSYYHENKDVYTQTTEHVNFLDKYSSVFVKYNNSIKRLFNDEEDKEDEPEEIKQERSENRVENQFIKCQIYDNGPSTFDDLTRYVGHGIANFLKSSSGIRILCNNYGEKLGLYNKLRNKYDLWKLVASATYWNNSEYLEKLFNSLFILPEYIIEPKDSNCILTDKDIKNSGINIYASSQEEADAMREQYDRNGKLSLLIHPFASLIRYHYAHYVYTSNQKVEYIYTLPDVNRDEVLSFISTNYTPEPEPHHFTPFTPLDVISQPLYGQPKPSRSIPVPTRTRTSTGGSHIVSRRLFDSSTPIRPTLVPTTPINTTLSGSGGITPSSEPIFDDIRTLDHGLPPPPPMKRGILFDEPTIVEPIFSTPSARKRLHT